MGKKKRKLFEQLRKNMYDRRASSVLKYGNESLYNEYINAQKSLDKAEDMYDRIANSYDRSEERKEELQDRVEDLNSNRDEMIGGIKIFGLRLPLISSFIHTKWLQMGITKKGKEFNKLERKIRISERTLARMNRKGTRTWDEILAAEKGIEDAEKRLSDVEKAIREFNKSIRNGTTIEDLDRFEVEEQQAQEEMREAEQAQEETREEQQAEQAQEETREEQQAEQAQEETREEQQAEQTQEETREEQQEEQTQEETREEQQEEQAQEETREDQKDKGNTRKSKFRDDVDVRLFTKEGVNIDMFKNSLDQLNINLTPNECILYMGILQIEGNKIKAETKEEFKEKFSRLAHETVQKIQSGEIEQWEGSKEYYMRSGIAQFVLATKSEEAKTPVEIFAQNIAQRYMDQKEADQNFRKSYTRQSENDRTA